MFLCEGGHDEVCYEMSKCPACELLAEIKELEQRVARLDAELEEALSKEDS